MNSVNPDKGTGFLVRLKVRWEPYPRPPPEQQQVRLL